MDQRLVGKCGLYCGACSIYRAERDDENLRKKIAERTNCSIDKVRCNGCGALSNECWGHDCKIVTCSATKGHEYCFECSEYQDNSCLKHSKLYTTYLEISVDLRDNSSKI